MTTEDANSSIEPAGIIDIAPDVSVLGVFRYLKYQPWFAIAEFVDNALDSHLRTILAVDPNSPQLKVKVHITQGEHGRLVITDNAGGIDKQEWQRALRPADPPPDGAILNMSATTPPAKR